MVSREDTNEAVAERMAKEMGCFVNNFACDEIAFVEAMGREHRTLQQNFTKLCVRWLEFLAKDSYGHDLRNEASYELAKKFVQRLDSAERALPLI